MFGNINSLEIHCCDNFGASKIVLPKALQGLKIIDAKNFKLECLRGLSNLEQLHLHGHENIKGNELGLTNLEEFRVENCEKFRYQGLQGITTLKKVLVKKCPLHYSDKVILQKLENNGCYTNHRW